MMDAFNKMDPEKRKRMVDRALDDMKKRAGEEPQRDADDPHIGKIVNEGLRSFYSEANAEVKMDLAPLIEQMQSNLQDSDEAGATSWGFCGAWIHAHGAAGGLRNRGGLAGFDSSLQAGCGKRSRYRMHCESAPARRGAGTHLAKII
jgi:hypothetical protein